VKSSRTISRLGALLAALATALLTGCKKEDMAVQPKLRTYEPTQVFADGSEARPLVAGTVARPPDMSPGIPYAQVWAPGPEGSSDSAPVQWIPMPVTRQLIDRGAQRFNIYCAVCHGRLGDGTGMIVQRGFVPPPSFHNDRLSDPRQTPDSHFYDVISNGYGAMFSYDERVAPADRWAIAAYIRVLQASVKQAARDGRISPEQYKAMKGVRP
jgi:mono/diheme cytochrome c family protein